MIIISYFSNLPLQTNPEFASKCYNGCMSIQLAYDLLILLGLGLTGWFVLAKLRLPAAEVLGPMVLIGTLRALQVEVPTSPDFLFPTAQVFIGIFVGSMLNRDTVQEIKPMALSALVIIAWAVSVALIVGFLLARFSTLDLYTAILSASMGGLPEITVIALASGASVAVIIVMQMLRMVGTVLLFPFILKILENKEKKENNIPEVYSHAAGTNPFIEAKKTEIPDDQGKNTSSVSMLGQTLNRKNLNLLRRTIKNSWKSTLTTLTLAVTGGLLFNLFGVPAGLLIGSTTFVAAVSVAGFPVSSLSPRLLSLLLVFIGITVADNISPQTFITMADPDFVIPILIATIFMFASSFGIAWIIFRLTGWDYPTSFLAAAPGGFTIMTALAVKHGRDPVKVSMLHLCRLLSLKLFIPFIFLYLMSR